MNPCKWIILILKTGRSSNLALKSLRLWGSFELGFGCKLCVVSLSTVSDCDLRRLIAIVTVVSMDCLVQKGFGKWWGYAVCAFPVWEKLRLFPWHRVGQSHITPYAGLVQIPQLVHNVLNPNLVLLHCAGCILSPAPALENVAKGRFALSTVALYHMCTNYGQAKRVDPRSHWNQRQNFHWLQEGRTGHITAITKSLRAAVSWEFPYL